MDTIERTDLPLVVADYVVAHNAKDADAAVVAFTRDATVVDDGRTYTGVGTIKAWVGTSSTEWTFTSTPIAFGRVDADHYVVVQHVEGTSQAAWPT